MSPVATSAARYPDATDGLIESVGVSVVEQLDEDCPTTAMMTEESSIAAAEKENINIVEEPGVKEKALSGRGNRPEIKESSSTSRISECKRCPPTSAIKQNRKLKSRACCRFAEWQKHEYEDAAFRQAGLCISLA